MNRSGRAAVMLTLGAIMGRLLWSGGFGWFVQQRMRLPLMGAAIVLVVFGVYEFARSAKEEQDNPESTRRSAGPAVGWLLLLPLVVLISVAPTGLGAAAADRIDAYTPTESQEEFDALDTSNGAPAMRVFDFLERAAWDEERSLEGQPVLLEGLVVNDPSVPDGFKLTRFMVSCCAADGIPLQVDVRGAGAPLEDETWVVAEVIWRPPTTPYIEQEGDWAVEADAVNVTVVPDAPNDPYESPY
ncbi:MAG: TIGR03943 family protein [Acidimicrobiia bacterium]|nr:TIGR03943 family protein [Acidimicrobiia bacterium]